MTAETEAAVARVEAKAIDFANWTYNTLPERTGNVGWQPDLQDLIYTAINHVEGDYEDADENCAEQVIERLVLAIKATLSALATEREKVAGLERERDEADRRAGAAERRIADLEEAGRRETGWLVEAKKSRGYDPGVSFDAVWSDTCNLADRAITAEALLAEAGRSPTPTPEAGEVGRLRAACTEAMLLFRHYEQLHLAKGTQDGDEKAHRNHEMAAKLEQALNAGEKS